MISVVAILCFIVAAEFMVIRHLSASLGAAQKDNASLKMTVRVKNEQLNIAARPSADLHTSVDRMRDGGL